MKKTFIIKDIDCANCALKIEDAIKKQEGIKQVHLDFAREKLTIEGDVDKLSRFELEKIAQNIEKDVHIFELDDRIEDIKQGFTLNQWIMYGIGLLFMIIGYIGLEVLDIGLLKFFSIIILIASYIIFGHTVLIKAYKNILKGQFFDEHLLMTIATLGAFAIGEFVEAIAVMLFYRIGEYLQDLSVRRSRKSIQSLLELKPEIAHKKTIDGIIDVEPEALVVGDHIIVRPGEKVPVDGIVISGSSWLDTKAITGESMPRDVFEGKEVVSGSLSISGLMTIQVLKTYENSTVRKIMDFVENNASKKAKTEQFITKFAKLYTPIVVALAFVLAFIIPLVISGFTQDTYSSLILIYIERALIFLVISCPCALVLSIPLSFFAGIGSGSRQGILFKSGSDIEMMNDIEHIVFDKTGTLTEGSFILDQIVSGEPELILEYAAHAEYHSNHPIAKTIIEAYGKPVNDKRVLSIREIAGKGIKANYEGIHLLVGNEHLMHDHHVKFLKTYQMGTIVYVAANQEFIGYLVIKDQLKKDAQKAVSGFKIHHKYVTMVSGDYDSEVKDVSFKVGIDDYYANCLPEDKVTIIDAIKVDRKVCFIGDGINDAPVLTHADLGIAMGGIGSDIAIEAADVVIMNDNPYHVFLGYLLARKTMRIVKQNIILALCIKILVLLLGAIGFANLWLAIFADVGVSILAVMNAMRIFYVKEKKRGENHASQT